MSELDLRKLSAPIEALISEVKAAYELLDIKWENVGKQLGSLAIPCAIRHTLWESPNCPHDYSCLEWRKYKGKRRFCITSYRWEPENENGEESIESIRPYEEWSAEERLEMLSEVPGLFEDAKWQIEKFIKRVNGLEADK